MANRLYPIDSTSHGISDLVPESFRRIADALCAFLLIRVWDYWTLMHSSRIQDVDGYGFLHPYIIACAILVAAAIIRTMPKGHLLLAIDIATTAIALIGSILISETLGAVHGGAAVVSLCLLGLPLGWFALRVLILLLRIPEHCAIGGIFVASMLVLIAQVLLALLVGLASDLIACCLPLGLFALLTKKRDVTASQNDETHRASANWRQLSYVCVCIGGIAFAYGLLNSFLKYNHGSYAYGQDASPFILLGGHAIALAMLAILYARFMQSTQTWSLPTLLRVPAAFIVACTLLIAFLGDASIAQILTFTAISLLMPIAWIVIIDVTHRLHLPACPSAAAGLLSYFLPIYLGALLHHGLISLGMTSISSPQVSAIVIVGSVLFGLVAVPGEAGGAAVVERPVRPDPALAENGIFAILDDKCRKVANIHGLSDRETQILKLLARGMTKATIADELYVSENTVRTHVKRIYSKLDVHNRDELLKLLGA
ncbi:helix-turn-helix transcriptional regulator [Adlercreutzia caecimuris]|uniref:helix-turn-helix transcriptional regulator n=1 Tax=Adlercreutzia caecimuris TaxID=671266 RepID=UPI002729DAAA|nr:helix-turn-helix transcriptional regulator [Adlercreutzia caecimuris]